MIRSRLILPVLAGALVSLPAVAAPGVALTLDVVSAVDNDKNPCVLPHPSGAHLILLHFEGDRFQGNTPAPSEASVELARFLQDLEPYLPEMIRRALDAAQLDSARPIAVENASFVPDLFRTDTFKGVPAYVPDAYSRMAFLELNKLLVAFLFGKFLSFSSPVAAPAGSPPYRLNPSPISFPGIFTPHLAVEGPSGSAAAASGPGAAAPPEKTVTANLQQTITLRWHR